MRASASQKAPPAVSDDDAASGMGLATAVPAACFFLSGFASLLYQVCWIRQTTLVFGAATFAVSTVVAVFFGGMALGAYLFGRYSQRTTHPLRVYAVVEVVLGMLGLASPLALALADAAYGAVYPALEESFASLALARLLLVAVALLPPTILIGGTLPLYCRHFVRSPQRIALSVGLLYAINTLGAAVGCAVTGLWLIPVIGIHTAIALGAALNVAIGVVIWFHPASARPIPSGPTPAPRPEKRRPRAAPHAPDAAGARTAIVFVLFFLVGFVALGNEILWTRFLSLLVRNTVYTYTVSLTVVLVGIVLGSALVSFVLDAMRRRALLFGLLQVVYGLLVLTVLLLPPAVWRSALDPTSVTASLWVFLAVLGPPAVLSGASFPLAVRMVVRDPALAGLGVGELTAVNTLGGIVGSLGLGFVMLPLLGLHVSLLFLTACSLLIGFAAWTLLEPSVSRWVRTTASAGAALTWIAIVLLVPTRLPQDFLAPPAALVDFREGLGSNVAIVRGAGLLRLEIDQLWQGQDRKSHQVMAAHIPMLLHPDARDVAVVGLGAGQTPGRFLMYDIERLDCIEIESRLIGLVRQHFDSDWMDDPRLRFIIEDGRSYLAHTRMQYDIIGIEVGQIFRPGLASFYTLDFYQAARRRLKPDGLLCQFVPLAAFEPDEFRTVVATFLEALPDSTLWYNTSELLLIGRNADGWRLAPRSLEIPDADAPAVRDRRFAHWGGPEHTLERPEVFLAGFLAGAEGLGRIAAGAEVYRDDRPYLEYSTARYLERGEAPIIDIVRGGLDPLYAILPTHRIDPATGLEAGPPEFEAGLPDLVEAAEAIREINLRDVIATAYQRSALELPPQQVAQRVQLLETAAEWNPHNVEIQRLLGDALLLAGRAVEAVERYGNAVRIDPASARARQHLGRGLYLVQRVPEAAEQLRIAVRLDPDSADTHNNLGAALAALGDLDGAITHFAEALRLRPDDIQARNNLERAREAQRQRGGAPPP